MDPQRPTSAVYLGIESYVDTVTGALTTDLSAFPARNADDWTAAEQWSKERPGRQVLTRVVTAPLLEGA